MTRREWKASVLGLGLALAVGCKSAAPPPEAPAAAPAQAAAVKPNKGPGHPYTRRHLYDETTDPAQLIAAGLKQAKAQHKRVILDFGGDWCGDCQVLDIYFHDPANWPIVEKKFVIVHVFIGHMDKNLELASSYGVPINRGVPALAVLSPDGKVLYSQNTGQFNDMRHMDVVSLTGFLNKWKA